MGVGHLSCVLALPCIICYLWGNGSKASLSVETLACEFLRLDIRYPGGFNYIVFLLLLLSPLLSICDFMEVPCTQVALDKQQAGVLILILHGVGHSLF